VTRAEELAGWAVEDLRPLAEELIGLARRPVTAGSGSTAGSACSRRSVAVLPPFYYIRVGTGQVLSLQKRQFLPQILVRIQTDLRRNFFKPDLIQFFLDLIGHAIF
jgi:hypothetical protein